MQQLSIFTENKMGVTKKMLSLLADWEINVLGMVSGDSGEFGVIRMLVSDTEAAERILTEAGFLCRRAEVIGVELVDEPGSMAELLSRFETMNVNIDYIYVGFIRENQTPVVVLHTAYLDVVSTQLKKFGYRVY